MASDELACLRSGADFDLPFTGMACFDLPVLRVRTFCLYWLPVLLVMALIFSGSTDVLAEHRTSRFIGPFLRWLVPEISESHLETIHHIIRKGGHVTEYAILAVLVWRALRKPCWRDPRPWSWRLFFASVAFCALYAMSDEFHQSYIPTRWASPTDVAIDTAGACIGILLRWGAALLSRKLF